MTTDDTDDTDEPGEPADRKPDGLELARAIARGLVGKGAARRKMGRKQAPSPEPRVPGRLNSGGFSGTHPDERDPQTLDLTMGRLVSERGWSADVRVHEVITRWGAIVGHDIGQHCVPETFDPDSARLVVRADSTAWATNLRLLLPTVVRRLAEELGDGVVTQVEVLGPSGPSWRKGRWSVRGGRGPFDTYG